MSDTKEIKPWSVVYEGSKQDIYDKVEADTIPEEVKEAIRTLLDLHADVPGWVGEDPADVWEREVPHTSADTPPKRLTELWECWWRVQAGGNPDAHSPTMVIIEPMRRSK